MKYFWFTNEGLGLTIAEHLIREGNEVKVGIVHDVKKLGKKEGEKPDELASRLKRFDGIIDKMDADDLLKEMKKIPKDEKDDWFVMCDFNDLYYYADKALAMGFRNGMFPTKKDRQMEEDRMKSKEFVKKNYKNLKVAETEEFKKVDDAVKFLEENEDLWVLKAYADGATSLTVVPPSDRPDFNHDQIINALQARSKEYESKGFLLEKKISPVYEVTPEAIFYNGELIATSVDIENKAFGAGNIGIQIGCAMNLIVKTDESDQINKLAFPKAVYDMAKDHQGMFVWDASLLYDREDYYFGEFCSNRLGWDSIFSEIAMAGSSSLFFESIVAGENPFIKTFGAAVRGVSQINESDTGNPKADIFINYDDKDEAWERCFFYDVQAKDDEYYTAGNAEEVMVATGASNHIDRAVDLCYQCFEAVSMGGMIYRPKADFMARDYPDSILNRYQVLNDKIFEQESANPF